MEKLLGEQKRLDEEADARARAREHDRERDETRRERDQHQRSYIDILVERGSREIDAAERKDLQEKQFKLAIEWAELFLSTDMYDDATRSAIEALQHARKPEQLIDASAMFVQIGIGNKKAALISGYGSKLIELLQHYRYANRDGVFRANWLSALDLLKNNGYPDAEVSEIAAKAEEQHQQENAARDERARISRAKSEAESEQKRTKEREEKGRLVSEAAMANTQVNAPDLAVKKNTRTCQASPQLL